MLSVKRNIIVLIFAVILLIYGVQSISYGQEDGTPTVTAGETNTSLKVSFTDLFYAFDEKAYQVQLRRKTPQGDWITKCDVISVGCGGGSALGALPIIGGFFGGGCGGPWRLTVYFIFTDLEPGTTYEARYRDTNLQECHDNPPAPDPWSEIAEGMTHLVPPPRVEFVDATLATAVRKALDLDTQGGHIELLQIPEAELPKLTALQYSSNDERNPPNFRSKIVNLTGLEHATQLATLSLPENNISDLSPLAQLTQLTTLDLSDNNISDLTPLAQLTQLTTLSLGGWDGNEISNILPLGQLTQLITLDLSDNNISDLTPLAQLTQLTMLSLPENNISDLTPLSQLTQLTELDLGGFDGNNISDLTPLAQLTQLTELDLGHNNISDVTPLAQLTQLTELDLGHNNISDVTPLAQLTQLTGLYLWFNNISDVTPLAQLINLEFLFLSYNDISDFTPLAQLSQRTRIYADELFKGVFHPSDIELMTVSIPQPLTSATLNGSSVTLTLLSNSAAYDTSIDNIRNALTLTGIDGVTVSDVIRVSDTELNVTFGFTGNLENTTTLTISLGAEAVSGYEGPALTVQVSVSGSTVAPVQPGTPTLRISTATPLTEATLHEGIITFNLSGATYNTNEYYVSQNVEVSGITGVTFRRHNVDRFSDTKARVELEFNGDITTDGTLTFTVDADAIADYSGSAITAQMSVSAVTESITASTASPLTEATLDESVVTLTLSGRKYERLNPTIRDAVSVSGISGVTVRPSDIDRENDTEITVELTFDGDLTVDGTLTFTVGAGAITGYNGPALTVQVSVSAGTETPVVTDGQTPVTPQQPGDKDPPKQPNNNTGGTPTLSVTATPPLTEATLHGGIITLNLSSGTFRSSIFWVRNAVSVSGITGVTLDPFGGERISDTQATIELEYDGNMTANGTLTISVGADAIEDYDGAALTSQMSVSAVTESVTASTAAPLTEATLDESVVTLTLSGRKYERFNSTIRPAVSVSGISGVTVGTFDIDRESDTEITVELTFNGDITTDGTLTFTVGADAIAGYNGPALTAQVSVTASRENALGANFPNPFNPETWIPYQLGKPTKVTISIYNVKGQLVRTLALRHQAAGLYQSRSRAAHWDGKNAVGEKVASGLYFYRLTAGDFSATRKMLIMK